MVAKTRSRSCRSRSRKCSIKRRSHPKRLRFYDLQQGKTISLPVKRYKIAENGRKYAEAEANGRKYTLFVKK